MTLHLGGKTIELIYVDDHLQSGRRRGLAAARAA